MFEARLVQAEVLKKVRAQPREPRPRLPCLLPRWDLSSLWKCWETRSVAVGSLQGHAARTLPPAASTAAAAPSAPRQVLEATRELITEANFEVSNAGLTLQAMDSSHVSLVALTLRSDGFEMFRCDRTFSMGE